MEDRDVARGPIHSRLRRSGTRPAQRAQAAGHLRPGNVSRPLVPHEPLGLRLYRRRPVRDPDDEARRQADRDRRHGRHRRPVHPTPGRRMQRPLRLSAHPFVRRCPRQPPDRCGLVCEHRDPRLAGAVVGEFRREPVVCLSGGRPRDGRLDRHRTAHPHPDPGVRPHRAHARGDPGRARAVGLRKDGRHPGARRLHRRRPRHRAEVE